MSTDPFEPFTILIEALLAELGDDARQRALRRAGCELDRYQSRVDDERAMTRREAELIADEERPGESITDPDLIAFLLNLEE